VVTIPQNDSSLRFEGWHSGDRSSLACEAWWRVEQREETMSLFSTSAPSGLGERPDFGNVSSHNEPIGFPRITGKVRVNCGAQ
jgi:hypothetical protein